MRIAIDCQVYEHEFEFSAACCRPDVHTRAVQCGVLCVSVQVSRGWECYLLDDHGNIILMLPFKDADVRPPPFALISHPIRSDQIRSHTLIQSTILCIRSTIETRPDQTRRNETRASRSHQHVRAAPQREYNTVHVQYSAFVVCVQIGRFFGSSIGYGFIIQWLYEKNVYQRCGDMTWQDMK